MKRFIRCTCLLLVMAMFLAIPAFAAETVDPRGSSYFRNSSVFICNVSGNSFEAWYDVTAVRDMDILGVNFIKIQRSSDGSTWTTVRTYTKESYPSLIDYNSTYHAAGVSYTATGGYYYRVYVQLYAKEGVNTATMNEYSAKRYFPAG